MNTITNPKEFKPRTAMEKLPNYQVLYPSVGHIASTKKTKLKQDQLFEQLQGWFFNNTGWALDQKVQQAFDALNREKPSAINEPAKEFIRMLLADGLKRYNQNTILERAEFNGGRLAYPSN